MQRLREERLISEEECTDSRFQGGLFPIDRLDDLKVSLVIKLNDTSFSFENQVRN